MSLPHCSPQCVEFKRVSICLHCQSISPRSIIFIPHSPPSCSIYSSPCRAATATGRPATEATASESDCHVVRNCLSSSLFSVACELVVVQIRRPQCPDVFHSFRSGPVPWFWNQSYTHAVTHSSHLFGVCSYTQLQLQGVLRAHIRHRNHLKVH